ncbi:Peroxisomal NADH pyrophosphatase nudt12 [Chytridiales sp. JEL 0842]|nr:Peroxisomal NADH pyrophosphatase nudt12 [Chytridiales sp. JEL 0842]
MAPGTTPTIDDLFAAIQSRSIPHLTSLISTHRSLIHATNDRKWTSLHMAARSGWSEGAKILLDAGANPKTKNGEGKTPGEVAAFWGYESVASMLGYSPASVSTTSSSSPVNAKNEPLDPSASNFFAGGLHRGSELRTQESYLCETLDRCSVLVLNGLKAIIQDQGLVFMKGSEVEGFVGDWGGLKGLAVLKREDNQVSGTVPPAPPPTFVYLGTDEGSAPYWALDATNLPGLLQYLQSKNLSFTEPRPTAFTLPRKQAAQLAHARAIVDWNVRNKYCPACGQLTILQQAGYKRGCLKTDCLANKGVQNFSYPRTDPVAIVCIVSPDGKQCLLGRQKAWPKNMYSCVAGFVEPSETLEDAARREAFEETSIRLGRVAYHSSQPWPFPSQLMVGMMGEAISAEVELVDKELDDAKWFTLDEIKGALRKHHPGEYLDTPADAVELTIPPPYAIAYSLIRHFADKAPNTFNKPKM